MLTLMRLAAEYAERAVQVDGVLLPAAASSTCRLATGRSALYHLIDRLPAKYARTVLLPCYVPEGVIKPFRAAGFDLRFYRLGADLQPDEGDVIELLGALSAPAVFMLLHYFGYPSANHSLLARLRQTDALVVSDCAQAPLTRTEDGIPLGEIGDVALYSLNKFIPVCDGAILSSLTPRVDLSLDEAVLPALPAATVEAYARHLEACRLLFDAPSPARAAELLETISAWYETYYQFINDDLTPRRQSPASRSIEACFPFAEAARLRRRHGARVHQALAGHPVIRRLWPTLPSQVVPFGIAVTVVGHRRDEVQRRLFDDDVLASTLVDKWDFVPPGGEARFPVERAFLRDHLLLPVSEFMSDDDTSRLIDALQRIN